MGAADLAVVPDVIEGVVDLPGGIELALVVYNGGTLVIGYCDNHLMTNIGAICRDLRSTSINIHDKREKNPSGKPEGAQPRGFSTTIFLEFGVNIMCSAEQSGTL